MRVGSATTTSPLDIPWQAAATALSAVDDDDDDDVPAKFLVSMSCPLPGNRPQKPLPRRPVVKPALVPKEGLKLPNLQLPPSLPSDYVVPELSLQQQQQQQQQPPGPDNKSFADFCYPYAASCPPAFRLVVDTQGGTPAFFQLEGRPMANSPLIYEVLLSGCLKNPNERPQRPADEPMRNNPASFENVAAAAGKDEDELAEMEL